jgi:FAD/FMN-containing dehydrogenase
MKVWNWGRYPVVEGELRSWRGQAPEGPWIARGLGRCYGDASLGRHMASTLSLDRFLSFDPQTGWLDCEAGLSYRDLLEVFVPRGWFPPVTPGTKFVTLGGALASDVHGKNHHVDGSFSRHVESFELIPAAGQALRCSREAHADWFWATAGGMGLTGLIRSLRLRLRPIESAWIRQEALRARSLEEILALFDQFEASTYSVAWIDSLAGGKQAGRSILLQGEHARLDELPPALRSTPLGLRMPPRLSVPFDFPAFALNPWSLRLFNALYYHKQLRPRVSSLVHYDGYFYPLDALHHWNRVYGRRGFVQYQLVIPKEAGREGIREVLRRVRASGTGSFLSVLKLFGQADPGWMSFPIPGYTLAMDFPVRKALFGFLDELDRLVADYGGRIYLSKDARLAPAMLDKMYPEAQRFKAFLDAHDPGQQICSHQAERLGMRGQGAGMMV